MMDAPEHEDLPPFIADQRLWRLDPPTRDRKRWVEPEGLTYRRHRNSKQIRQTESLPAHERPWVEVESRLDLIADRSLDRLCVLSDAGRGKSNLLEQMEYVLNTHPDFSRHMAVFIKFEDIPADPAGIVTSLLVHAIAERQVIADRFGSPELYSKLAKSVLLQQLGRGEFTLLVDALDQVNVEPGISTIGRAKSLARFAATHPYVRVVVSGRPSAILAHWNELFATNDQAVSSDWEFVLVDEFTREQTEIYLGAARWRAVERLDAETLAIPRSLAHVRELEPEELQDIRTRGELYWVCLDRLLHGAFHKQALPIDREAAEFLLGLLAFECLCQNKLARIDGTEFVAFRNKLWSDRAPLICERLGFQKDSSRDVFEKVLGALAMLNDFLDPGAIKDGCRHDAPGKMIALEWNNLTTMCFFAALWMVRWATDEDRSWLGQNLVLRTTPRDSGLRELWRFVVELPGADFTIARSHLPARNDEYYAKAFSVLFARNDEQRSTEMQWRAWPELLRLAGYTVSRDSSEREIEEESLKLAEEVHQCVDAEENELAFDGAATPKGIAKSALWSFLREFPDLCRTTTAPGKLARSLCSPAADDPHYVLCPPKGKSSTFVMGSPDGVFVPPGATEPWPAEQDRLPGEDPHVVTMGPDQTFWLRDFVVTNAEYELFEPEHKTGRSNYSPADAQPAVNVSWHDAVMYCRWLGPGFRLPTEQEWECACRAIEKYDPQVPQPRFWYGNKPQHEFMNFDEQQSGTTARLQFPANEWGMYDMLGNVWEWCSNRYREPLSPGAGTAASNEEQQANRTPPLLRGGSWGEIPAVARCAFGNWFSPGDRNFYTGFRLSRTP